MAFLKIKELATLQSGFPLGSKHFVKDGNAWVLQSSSVERFEAEVEGGPSVEDTEVFPANDAVIDTIEDFIDFESVDFIDFESNTVPRNMPHYGLRQASIPKLTDEKIVQPNDILFRARSPNFDKLNAYVPFSKGGSSNLINGKPHIITNTFILLRPNGRVLPHYLAWSINNHRNMSRIISNRSGAASILTISIKQLAEVVLPVPDLKIQRTILAASENDEELRAIEKASHYITNELLCELAQKNS